MTQTEINQVVEAMQLTPKYKNILRKCLNGDNEEVKNSIKKLNDADIELNTKLNELANKVNNLKTDVFAVVDSLPTENIENKIYCIKDTTDGGTDNKFIEYIYIETTKSWEKVGEFKADPDLSGYAKLSGNANTFTNRNTFNSGLTHVQFLSIDHLGMYTNTTKFFNLRNTSLISINKYMSSNGTVEDAGVPEEFVFTLEDGSTVTKSIRVISTTNN